MFSHVVLYKVNPANPAAAEQIVRKASFLLGGIFTPRDWTFQAARISTPTRVVEQDEYQVVLNCIFARRGMYPQYMHHPRHIEFVKFVLRGWMLKGSSAPNPEEDLINHILFSRPVNPPIEWVRNPDTPDSEVVWADERVIDAESSF